MSMKFGFCILGVALVCFAVSIGAADIDDLPHPGPGEQAPADPIFDADLTRGIDLVSNEHYTFALALLDSLEKVYPDHPAPYFYEAATLQTWMSAYRFNGFQDRLEKSVGQVIATGDAMMKKEPKNPWIDFYMGGAYGYKAFYEFRRLNWLGAYRDGMKGIGHLRDCLVKEPRLYDAYLGLGAYYYWRTARSKMLRWLLFWLPDKRDLGIAQIELAMRHGRYAQDEARLVLATTLFDRGQYLHALAVLNERAKAGLAPNMFELYLRGRLMEALNRWPTSEQVFREILGRLDEEPHTAIGYRVECDYRLARALAQLGRRDEALVVAHEAIVLSAKRNADAELDGVLSDYGDVKHDLDDLYRRLSTETRAK